MDSTLLVAKILGVYFVVSGLFMIFRGKTVPHMLKDFFGHPAIVYLTGVILIFLSTLYLLGNNIWDSSWRSIITVIAWATLLKGLLYILAPQVLEKMANKKHFASLNIYGLIAIVAGLSLYAIN